jgi:hypothetical protein
MICTTLFSASAWRYPQHEFTSHWRPTHHFDLLVFRHQHSHILIQPIRPNLLAFQLTLKLANFARPFFLDVFADFTGWLPQIALVRVCPLDGVWKQPDPPTSNHGQAHDLVLQLLYFLVRLIRPRFELLA